MNQKVSPFTSIASLKGYDSVEPIHDGYSGDQKYLVLKSGAQYLLRTFKATQFEEKEKEYKALVKMAEMGVRCSKPLEMGYTQGQDLGYMLLTFIEGIDGGKALPTLSIKDQYRIGIEAGEELRKINQYEAPSSVSPWHERKLAKHERYLRAYRDGDVKINGDTKFISFIEKNLHLMENRPNLFQHDDFHIRNLIIKNRSLSGVIDFNRCDWGDPYHEFLKVGQFSSEVSIPFSVGQIRGYFEGSDPDGLFWQLYSLYTAMALISGVIWTKHVCPDEMPDMMMKFERVLRDHNWFERIKPDWYSSYD